MLRFTIAAAAVLGALPSMTRASTVTIDFGGYPADGSSGIVSYSVDGYLFTPISTYLYPVTPTIGGGNEIVSPNPFYFGSNALGVAAEGVRIQRIDGQQFDLDSVSFGSFSTSTAAPTIDLTTGLETSTAAVTQAGQLQSFSPMFTTISVVTFTGDVAFQFTDLVLTSNAITPITVPEPSSAVLAIVGCLSLATLWLCYS